MQYHRTELSWTCFVSLCPVFPIFGLSSWFVPLELLSLLRQSSFSLLGLLRCSLCSLIPTLLLNFSASWDLAFSHLPKQSQRLYQDNSSFHQLCQTCLLALPFLVLQSTYPCGDWLLPILHVKWVSFLPAVPFRLLWRGWGRHCASCTLLLGRAGTTKSYCATTSRSWFILWGLLSFGKSVGKHLGSFMLLC